jgi:lysyl-tRNA synthetase class I
MSYQVKCSKCGRTNKVRKLPNKPTYEMKCECGAISDIKAEVFDNYHGGVISFVCIGIDK